MDVGAAIMTITQADILANIPALQQVIRTLSRFQREELAEWMLNGADFNDFIAEEGADYGAPDARHPLTVEEFLEIENGGGARHEYIAGEMFEMRQPMPRHGLIVANLLGKFREHLATRPSRIVTTDLGVRLRVEKVDVFYRPDIMVACGPFTPAALDLPYLTDPSVIVEVFSPITEDIDRREKALNYRRIASLEEYVLIAQRSPLAIISRRSCDWTPVVLTGIDAVVESCSVELSMSLKEIYAGAYLR
jgi:Uma2 family endonuclease